MTNPTDTQAIILAAGSGTRLRPLTLDTPKCLIDVGGKTILARQLERLAAAGIRRAVVVTGYLNEQVTSHLRQYPQAGMEVRLAPNADYATTGNCMSVLAARGQVDAGTIVLCDGDVVLTGDALTRLAAEPCSAALLLDTETRLAEEEMKAELDAKGNVRRLSKQLDPATCAGESIGIQKVGGAALPIFWATLESMRDGGDTQGYYEDAFQRMVNAGVTFRTVPIGHHEWTEIDDLADLEDARARFTR
ncbi:MAG TPA: phosphocholine cytidylyltransferase family protein [Gemmatimonadales bacterium]|nr:phosphocholine cytidylyltransferase family protein [Gemmatimonadales bacterium]